MNAYEVIINPLPFYQYEYSESYQISYEKLCGMPLRKIPVTKTRRERRRDTPSGNFHITLPEDKKEDPYCFQEFLNLLFSR